MSCATCHDPASAHAQPNASPVQSGGAQLDVPGFRAVPSLRYLRATPAFFFDDEGTPTGGFDRDGRVGNLIEQARRPFLAAHEMANASADDVAVKLSHAAYAVEFRQVFGDAIFSTPDAAFDRALFALQKYQQEDTPRFAPFTSKYDAFLAGRTTLSAQEQRGFALYNDPQKGNCAGCHPSARADGKPPLFTDFTYDNLGVPRNARIPANADPNYFDLGLCGPDAHRPRRNAPDLCGAFKVPTLRNVAITAPFFHNGRFDTLIEVVRSTCVATRPGRVVSARCRRRPRKFDDLPPAYAATSTLEVPYNRHGARRRASTPYDRRSSPSWTRSPTATRHERQRDHFDAARPALPPLRSPPRRSPRPQRPRRVPTRPRSRSASMRSPRRSTRCRRRSPA